PALRGVSLAHLCRPPCARAPAPSLDGAPRAVPAPRLGATAAPKPPPRTAQRRQPVQPTGSPFRNLLVPIADRGRIRRATDSSARDCRGLPLFSRAPPVGTRPSASGC